MNYFKKIKENEELQEALFEIPASFFFVLVYFILIEQTSPNKNYLDIAIGSFLFMLFYYIAISIIAPRAKVQILPVISFIYSIIKNDFAIFIYRVPGQLVGALLATLLHIAFVRFGADTDFSVYVKNESPVLTALFTGFIAQVIYLSYYFLVFKLKITNSIKLLLFAICLGIVFMLVSLITQITLLNPFGTLFHYLLNGNIIDVRIIVEGFIVHIFTPMIFIAGTHLFITGYKNMLDYTQSWQAKE